MHKNWGKAYIYNVNHHIIYNSKYWMAVEPQYTWLPSSLSSYILAPSSPTFLIIQGLFPETDIVSLVWSLYFIGEGNVTQKSKNSSLKLFFFFFSANQHTAQGHCGWQWNLPTSSGSRLSGLLSPVPLILLVRFMEVPGTQKSNCTR